MDRLIDDPYYCHDKYAIPEKHNMPLYEYLCTKCDDVFTKQNTILNYKQTSPCPDCGQAAKRNIFSAPSLNAMNPITRKAHQTNERSAHEPKVRNKHRHVCSSSCNHSHEKSAKVTNELKQQNGKRPWMIGH